MSKWALWQNMVPACALFIFCQCHRFSLLAGVTLDNHKCYICKIQALSLSQNPSAGVTRDNGNLPRSLTLFWHLHTSLALPCQPIKGVRRTFWHVKHWYDDDVKNSQPVLCSYILQSVNSLPIFLCKNDGMMKACWIWCDESVLKSLMVDLLCIGDRMLVCVSFVTYRSILLLCCLFKAQK